MAKHYTCQLDSETRLLLKIYLLKNVANLNVVTENIKSSAWKCATINPTLIVDPLQVAVAANRAVVSQSLGRLVTRSVYGEILYNLSLSKNISQSLAKFGESKDNAFLVCFLVTEQEDNSMHIVEQIDGEVCPIEQLANYTNFKSIKDVYKLSNIQDEENFLDHIISRMAAKQVLTHG